ncbi:MAG: glycosyltransferase family 2 protein [Oscillospiraceae bacterium]|nr:glycosyltransferase family 2 protein [Oscillospiraceae bacterium]
MSKCKLTVLTPTFNRAGTLGLAYESLCNQSCKDFIWLIVDDGSADETSTIVSQWQLRQNGFDIQYFHKENGGKHTAINFAAKHIVTDLVLILDSDDYLTADAVSTVLESWKNYGSDTSLCGLSFHKGYDNIRPIQAFPQKICRSNHIDFRINSNFPGDCCEVIRTDVLRQFPFPEYPGERFLGEGYLWVNAAHKYDTVYISKIIYICNYLDGGLTKSGRKMRLRNPRGGMLTSKVEMHPRICIKQRIKKAILYSCYGFAAGLSIDEIVKSSGYPAIVAIFLPLGYFFYRYWNRQ